MDLFERTKNLKRRSFEGKNSVPAIVPRKKSKTVLDWLLVDVDEVQSWKRATRDQGALQKKLRVHGSSEDIDRFFAAVPNALPLFRKLTDMALKYKEFEKDPVAQLNENNRMVKLSHLQVASLLAVCIMGATATKHTPWMLNVEVCQSSSEEILVKDNLSRLPLQIQVSGKSYELGGVTVHSNAHFTSLIPYRGKWCFYDGLRIPVFQPANISQCPGLISSLYYFVA